MKIVQICGQAMSQFLHPPGQGGKFLNFPKRCSKIFYRLMRYIINFNFPFFSYMTREVMCHISHKGGYVHIISQDFETVSNFFLNNFWIFWLYINAVYSNNEANPQDDKVITSSHMSRTVLFRGCRIYL